MTPVIIIEGYENKNGSGSRRPTANAFENPPVSMAVMLSLATFINPIVADAMEDRIMAICEWKEEEVIALKIRPDHVHLVCSIPPKLSVLDFMVF